LPPIAAVSAQKHGPKPPKQPIVLPSYVIPIAVGLVVVASIIALPKILGRRVESSAAPSTGAARVAPQSGDEPADSVPGSTAKPNASSPSRDASRDSSRDSAKSAASAKPSAKDISHAPAASPSPAALRAETKPSIDASKSSASAPTSGSNPAASSGKGEVLDQILPDIPDKALATISGRVRVTLRAHVDAAGNVSSSDFENPGPSKYFADAAQKALRRWEFTPPEVSARSVASDWLVRFEFTPTGVKAFPTQVSP
jgi:periplasmic protein TonB